MKSKDRKREREGIAGFKRWVASLSREELLDAMAFTFQSDTNSLKSLTPMPKSSTLDASIPSTVNSHEYELLLSMVELQPPPATPVHPRAMGYRPRSQKGARLDYFFKEEEHLRWTKPRLFQWVERQQPSLSNDSNGGRGNRDLLRSRNRKKNPGATPMCKRRFDAIARRKIAPWGDVYSLGCTQEQYDADCQLIEGTRLGRQRRDGNYHSTACFEYPLRREDSNINESGTKHFARGDKDSGKSNGAKYSGSSAAQILRMLRIASRGQIFRQHPMSFASSSPKEHIPYCAQWLEPTERWFSLSMYLASRFEVALWDSYLKNQSDKRRQKEQSALDLGHIIRLGGNWDNYKETVIRDSLLRAIQSGIRVILKEEQSSSRLKYLRDGTLWSILIEHNPKGHTFSSQLTPLSRPILRQKPEINWRNIARTWTHCQLVGTHNPSDSKFRSLVCEKLEEELVAQMERSIFEDEQEEKNSRITNGRETFKNKKRRKKNKRKKKKDRFDSEQNTSRRNTTSTNLSTSVSSPSDSSSVEGESTSMLVARTTYEFPQNSIPTLERNRNIVFVLGILEDLTEQAFTKLGLAPTPNFNESVEDATTVTVATSSNAKRDSSLLNQPPNKELSNKNYGGTQASIGIHSSRYSSKSFTSELIHTSRSLDEELMDHNDENSFSLYVGKGENSHSDVYNPFTTGSDFVLNDLDDIGGYVDNWRYANRYQSRERSILTNFFESQNGKNSNDEDDDDEERLMASSTAASIASSTYKDTAYVAETEDFNVSDNVDQDRPSLSTEMSGVRDILNTFFESQNRKIGNVEDDEDEERLMAASTAASIASSTYKDTAYVVETEDLSVADNEATERTPLSVEMSAIRETDDVCSKNSNESGKDNPVSKIARNANKTSSMDTSLEGDLDISPTSFDQDSGDLKSAVVVVGSDNRNKSDGTTSDCRSPTLQAPTTPPPTLSPILVSLADLKKLKRFPSLDLDNAKMLSGPGSLPPNSPAPQDDMVCNWSREALPIESFRDDHHIRNSQRDRIKSRSGLEIPTYKSIAVKALPKLPNSSRDDSRSLSHEMQSIELSRRKQDHNKESCAQSETAMDLHQGEHQDWYREEVENQSLAKDETTTIISGISHRVEPEELAVVREERNNFRDMCLTLGAEVAKLKAMLATQQAAAAAPVDFQDSSLGYSKMYGHGSFDPHGMQPFFHGVNNGLRPGPMSDAGFHRYGDHESLFSEDDTYDPISKVRDARMDSTQRMASSQTIASQTVAGSDASIDFGSIKVPLPGLQMPGTMSTYDYFHFNGLQSRLTKDILQFLDATNMKLTKLEGRRKLAIERFSRLVKTVWPRAQVKLYGSYISGLCLPSSDLDFVVCLPAVHKKDLALAPGVLEGRNAINETSQKLLARELKGESWVDPRSIKVIERTAVPVIKVSTKDTRARMIQLDISFDGPEHHGLDANRMVLQTLEELPLIRPLMLVLKEFLMHRGLLTAYTGGLSSYCLFLMLARYLQEQPPSSGDCGSLLMGFLDFYGNFFDPRAIGISVAGRRYFPRANSHTAAAGYEPTGQPVWNRSLPPHQQHQNHVVINNLPPMSSSNSIVFRRRNSFSDTGSVDDSRHRHRFFTKSAAASTVVTSGSNHRYVPRSNNTPSPHPKEINFRTTNDSNNNFSGYDRPSTFDPLFVEDPLSATNNVGRNAFRINQVQRAFSDAHRALVASLDWDLHCAEGNGKYPLLKCLLGNQREDVLHGT